MLLDLLLAIAHHILMFGLLAILVIEIAVVRPETPVGRLLAVARLDAAYGVVAALVLVVGFSRVFFGLKGPEFYLHNPIFWAKIAAFLVVGALSVPPTLHLLAWRSAARGAPDFRPSPIDIGRARRFMHMEAAVFILIPIFAAMMARGYGL